MLGEWEMPSGFVKPCVEQVYKVRRRLLEATGQLGFPSKLVDAIQPGQAVHADRRVGKTRALLWAICERHQGEAILIVTNGNAERAVDSLWEELMRNENQFSVHKPKIIMSPRSPMMLEGTSWPVYCDEWFQYPSDIRLRLCKSGRIAGAIGSQVADSGFHVYPL